jgi:hypothetical protein
MRSSGRAAEAAGSLAQVIDIYRKAFTMAGTHNTALFADSAGARAAQAGLVAAGVDASRILVLDCAHAETAAHATTPGRLWSLLKHVFVPDRDAHPYAEGIHRGRPLVIADVTEAERPAAVQALQAAHPLDVAAEEAAWRAEGWTGTYPGEEEWLAAQPQDREAASSEGIVAGHVIAGDYGAVGGMIGGRVDTNILRGKSFTGGDATAERAGEVGNVRLYKIS